MGVCLLIKISFVSVDWFLQERKAEHPSMLLFREACLRGKIRLNVVLDSILTLWNNWFSAAIPAGVSREVFENLMDGNQVCVRYF